MKKVKEDLENISEVLEESQQSKMTESPRDDIFDIEYGYKKST